MSHERQKQNNRNFGPQSIIFMKKRLLDCDQVPVNMLSAFNAQTNFPKNFLRAAEKINVSRFGKVKKNWWKMLID